MPEGGDSHPTILFDGVCNLCNRSVQFVIRNDPRAVFRLAPLTSDAARATVAAGQDLPDSMVLVENGRTYVRSTAVLRIARRLRWPWPLAYAFIVIPAPIRDAIYSTIARNRYRWFGKRDSCMVPQPGLRDRFLP